MSATSEFLARLGSDRLTPLELVEFERMLTAMPDRQAQDEALEDLLRVVRLESEQVAGMEKWQIVRERGGLQLAVKRYGRAQQYASSNAVEQARKRSPFALAWDVIKGIFQAFPFP